jgi:hypothetical protein
MMKQSFIYCTNSTFKGRKGTDMKADNSVSETELTSTYLVEIRNIRKSK